MKLAIFDFNGTIFPKETMPYILDQWHKQGYSKKRLIKVFAPLLPLYIKYKLNLNSNMSREEMEKKAVRGVSRLFKGYSEKKMIDFFTNAAQAASCHFNQKVICEINRTARDGYHQVLLSGAFYPFLLQVAENLGIETVIGTELPLRKHQFKDLQEVEIIRGSSKLEKIKRNFKEKEIDWEGSCAYADSFQDLELLEAVGFPVVVEPDEKLATIADDKSWEIL